MLINSVLNETFINTFDNFYTLYLYEELSDEIIKNNFPTLFKF